MEVKDWKKIRITVFIVTGPFCQREGCREKDMSCGCPCEKGALPLALLRQDYPAALEGGGQ